MEILDSTCISARVRDTDEDFLYLIAARSESQRASTDRELMASVSTFLAAFITELRRRRMLWVEACC